MKRFPSSFVTVRSPADEVAPVHPIGARGASNRAAFTASGWRATGGTPGERAWHGVKILEFGSGVAGPIATRLRRTRRDRVARRVEDAARLLARLCHDTWKLPHGLEGSAMYDGLNVGKRNVALNLKHPDSVVAVKRLVAEWADAYAENYVLKAMKGFGLDYDACSVRSSPIS